MKSQYKYRPRRTANQARDMSKARQALNRRRLPFEQPVDEPFRPTDATTLPPSRTVIESNNSGAQFHVYIPMMVGTTMNSTAIFHAGTADLDRAKLLATNFPNRAIVCRIFLGNVGAVMFDNGKPLLEQ